MKNFIVSSKLKKDKFGIWSSNYDIDIQNFLSLLDIQVIPYLGFKGKISKKIKNAKGLILLGGGDLFKYHKTKENEFRDKIEKSLFKHFYNSNKPIIAICRGFQLIMDIYGIPLVKKFGHVRTKHSLKINKSRFVQYKKLIVNSYHNYIVESVPNDFRIVSKMNDGSIEITEHKKKKILCLMFHPERKMQSKKDITACLKKFIK